MMKALKFGFVIAMIAMMMAAGLMVPLNVRAQELGITWSTGIQIQNLGTAQTTATVTYYPGGATVTKTIAANSSVTMNPVEGVSDGFQGAAIVTADQPVAAIMNLASTSYFGSATGIASGSTSVGLPLVQSGNAGYETWFSIQNAGDAAATASLKFTPVSADRGNAHTMTTASISPGSNVIVNTQDITEIGDRFVGSVTVTSDQPMAAMVNQTGLETIKNVLTYSGFSGGSTEVRLPLVMNANSAFWTGVNVQNVGTAATTVKVTYSAPTKGTVTPTEKTISLDPGAAATISQKTDIGTDTYVGSITLTADQPLVAVVNQIRDGSMVGTSYEGIDPATGSASVSAPLIMSNNGGFNTGIQCQNVGTGTAAVNIAYGPNGKGTFAPTANTASIAAGASATVLQSGDGWTERYVGSATITSTGSNIACIVNQLNATDPTKDTFLTYKAINN